MSSPPRLVRVALLRTCQKRGETLGPEAIHSLEDNIGVRDGAGRQELESRLDQGRNGQVACRE
jgi:hypothetical protein